ncbi:MAG: phospholipase D-like domain-containing protein [Candidatus Doudnabacteria bacterium]
MSRFFRYTIIFCLSLVFWFLFNQNLSFRERLLENGYAQTKVLYSKDDKIDEALVSEIQAAEKFVYFAVYTITKENIVNALIAAKLRGLEVVGVLDANQIDISEEKPWVKKLKKYGIVLKIPAKESGLMHLKMLVTDKAYASGSFNYTVSAASYNDEVIEIGRVEGIRKQYLSVFRRLFERQ